MYKNITLNEFIAELQKLAVEHGNDEILSIGSGSGKIAGMSSPFCFNFKGHDATEFVPAFQEDVRAMPAQDKGYRGKDKGEVSPKATELNDRDLISRSALLEHAYTTAPATVDNPYGGAYVVDVEDIDNAPAVDVASLLMKPIQVQAAPVREAEGELKQVWARVGMTLDITPEEEKSIFEGDYLAGKAAVKRVVMDGRASLDGETYIPEECIEDFDDEYGTHYQKRDEECAWTMDGEYVNVSGSVHGLDGLGLPSVEQVEELVGQLRKYSEEEYGQHNNYIAEDLADAAEVLGKLVAARVFASEDLARVSVDGLIEEAAERSGSSGVVNGNEQNYQKG